MAIKLWIKGDKVDSTLVEDILSEILEKMKEITDESLHDQIETIIMDSTSSINSSQWERDMGEDL